MPQAVPSITSKRPDRQEGQMPHGPGTRSRRAWLLKAAPLLVLWLGLATSMGSGWLWAHHDTAMPEYWQPWLIGLVGSMLSVTATVMVWVMGRRRRDAERLAAAMSDSWRQSEARFRAAIEGGLSAFYLLQSVRDAAGRIVDFEFVDVNDRGLAMIYLPREQVIGRKLCELLPINRTDGYFEKYKRVVETGQLLEEEFEINVSYCRANWLHHQVVKVGDGVAITSDDITDRKLAEQALQKERTRLTNIIDGTNAGTWEWNVQTGETVFNDRWAEMLGYTLAELEPTNIETWKKLSHPDDLPRCLTTLEAHFAGDTDHYDCEFRMKHKDGQWVWIHDRGRVLTRDADGRPLQMFGTHSDITKRKHIERELRKLSQAVEQAAASVVITDTQGFIQYVNPAFCENTGYLPEEVLGQNPRVLKSGNVDPQVYRNMWEQITRGKTWRGEFHNRRKDGSLYWELATIAPVTDETHQITHYVAVKDEISSRKSMEQRLLTAATTDTLTGLANRSALSDRLEAVLRDNPRDGSQGFAILFLDFDRFKTINDSLGHDAGDELLKQIAGRLSEAVDCGKAIEQHLRANIIARLGGDEFVILLEQVNRVDEALFVADCVLNRLARPYDLNGYDIVSTASIGVVIGGLDQDTGAEPTLTPIDFLRDGDTAMYEAKLAGKGCYRVFDADMRRRARSRLDMESDLRRALDNNEFFIEYQPIIDLQNGDIESVEALVRWRHPERGLVSPGEFIPIAEEAGIIHDIGAWVLRTACRQFVQWQNDDPASAPKAVSVNLSRGQFNRTDLTDEVAQILRETGMPPERLHLEVTETAVMSDVNHAIAVLQKLNRLGIKIDMDDFGTGQSSLACLRELPFDILKIDRTFIAGLERSREMAAMIQAVIQLAYNLGIAVVAEGIETHEQLVVLQALECGYGQGFFFSKPMPANEVSRCKATVHLIALP